MSNYKLIRKTNRRGKIYVPCSLYTDPWKRKLTEAHTHDEILEFTFREMKIQVTMGYHLT